MVDVLLELQSVGVQLSDIELIISGGQVRVDFVANELSDTLGVPLRVVPDYTRHGHRAPFIRNNDIIKHSDFVLAFWDGESRGQPTLSRWLLIVVYRVRLSEFHHIHDSLYFES